jgi:hypothetical protein
LQAWRNAPQFIGLQESSLLRKTLRGLLNQAQLAKFEQLSRTRKKQLVEAALSVRLNNRDGITLPNISRQQVIDTLVNAGRIPEFSVPYSPYVVLLEAVRMEDRLRPLMTDAEWQSVEALAAQAKQLEPMLKASGFWPAPFPEDEDPQPNEVKD